VTAGSPAAFARSVRDRLKAASQQTGRRINELEREFVLQRFLARIFAESDSPWILKGGIGLLVRLPGARYSQDLDLLHPATELGAALADLGRLAEGPHEGDPFRFVLGPQQIMRGGVTGATVQVEAYLGATVFARFPIDLSTELDFVAGVERKSPRPVLEIPGLAPLPEVTLYPLPDQIADKICAMYQRYSSG